MVTVSRSTHTTSGGGSYRSKYLESIPETKGKQVLWFNILNNEQIHQNQKVNRYKISKCIIILNVLCDIWSPYLQCMAPGLTTYQRVPRDREECMHTASVGGRSSIKQNNSLHHNHHSVGN